MGRGAHVLAYTSLPTMPNKAALCGGRKEGMKQKRELLCQDFTTKDQAA